MKNVHFATLLTGLAFLLFLQTTETSAQKPEKLVLGKRLSKDDPIAQLNDSLYKQSLKQKDILSFTRIAIVTVKTKTIVCDTIVKKTIYDSRFFKNPDPQFQGVFEKQIVYREAERIDSISVYEFNRRVNQGMHRIDHFFEAIDTNIRMVLNQSQILEFCKSKEVKKWLRKNKNGGIYFVLRCDDPNLRTKSKSGSNFNNKSKGGVGLLSSSNNNGSTVYMENLTNYVKVTKHGFRLTIEYYKRAAGQKLDTKFPALFVVVVA